jgi:hypothetical protein
MFRKSEKIEVALEVDNGLSFTEIASTRRGMGLPNQDKMILGLWHTQLVQ